MTGTWPEAPIGGPHPEPKASAGITAALSQALASPLEPLLVPPLAPPRALSAVGHGDRPLRHGHHGEHAYIARRRDCRHYKV
jgi:hypothetical protein